MVSLSALEEYIAGLSTWKIEKRLGPSQEYFLRLIGEIGVISTYQIQKVLQNTKFQMKYKNVYEKMQILYESGFVEKVENVKLAKGGNPSAIYFRLSDFGLHYLLAVGINADLEKLIANYPKSVVLNTVVGLFFQRSTIAQSSKKLYAFLKLYAANVCYEIDASLKVLRLAKEKTERDQEIKLLQRRMHEILLGEIIYLILLTSRDKETLMLLAKDGIFLERFEEVKKRLDSIYDKVMAFKSLK